MRSPFYYFRKHQKVLLAVFGVALMIAFTVGGIALQFLGPGGGEVADDTAVVTFTGGSLTAGEMANLRWRHRMVRMYLRDVVMETYKADGTPGRRMVRATRDSDAELLHTVLLAQKAEELGIVITDKAITDFLIELSDGKLTLNRLDEIREQRFGKRLPFDVLVQSLRQELAAKSMEELVLSGLATRTETRGEQYAIEPSRAWQYYGQLNREVTAEILPLKVEDYIKETPEPTEKQIAELYEQHKHDFTFPNDPEPGFKQRDRIALAYAKADYNKFLAEEKAKLTDEEIETYYNEHINEFRKPELPPERETTNTESDDQADEDAAKENADGDAKKTDGKADTATGTEGEPPVGDETTTKDDAKATSPPRDDGAAKTPAEQPAGDAAQDKDVAAGETDATSPKPVEPESTEATTEKDKDDSADAAPAPDEKDADATDTDATDADATDADATDTDATDTDASNDAGGPSAEETDDSKPADPASGEDAQLRVPHGDIADMQFVALLDDPAEAEAAADTASGEDVKEPTDEPAQPPTEPEAGSSGAAIKSAGESEETSSPSSEPAGDAPVESDDTNSGNEDSANEPTDSKAKDTPAAEGGAEKGVTDDAAADEQPAGGETDTPEDKPAPKYQSLEEAREEIRGRLAAQPAQERMDEALNAVVEEITRYYQERALWEVEKADTGNDDLPAPNPPNLKPVLDEFGLTSGETPEVDGIEIADYDVGKAEQIIYFRQQAPDGTPMRRPPQRMTLVSEAFGEGVPLYRPRRFPRAASDSPFSSGTANEQYVYWKTSETPSHVPELENIREEVIKAWKQREAVKLARKAAEQYAQQAREGGLSLVSKFGEEKVTETGKFTFYDRISQMLASARQGRLQISTVDGVEQPGRKFMRTVFDHEAGDVFVALNEPENQVYVVRIKTDQPSEETLKENFKASLTVGPEPGLPYEIQLLAQYDVGELLLDWLKNFEKETDVQWKRAPQPGSPDPM